MTDKEKIAQWITSDLENNSPIYVDICKKVIPLYGSITSDDIHYRLEQIDKKSGLLRLDSNNLNDHYLHIFVTDKCYREEYKHSMETLISVVNTDKIQPSPSTYHLMPNTVYFNNSTSSPYHDTIFNYNYVMMHVRELKLTTIFDGVSCKDTTLLSSSSKDDVKNEIKKNSPEYTRPIDVSDKFTYVSSILPTGTVDNSFSLTQSNPSN